MVQEHRQISDHGLIGDLQTAALVSLDGTVDWFCSPKFDAPSIFASLLDAKKGGHFQLTVAGDAVIKQLYLVDTAVLVTRYLTPAGVGEVTDFMPVDNPTVASDNHQIVRLARVVRGEVTFRMECAPKFDYGRAEHRLTLADHHALFVSDNIEMSLHTTAPLSNVGGKNVRNGVAHNDFTLRAGEVSGVILATGAVGRDPGSLAPDHVAQLLENTIRYWRTWTSRSTYVGRWRETVNRSALTIKLMTYAPTGAMVAAPTAGLPEKLGGERNWDYRFAWVRDGSLALTALTLLGYTDEAVSFLSWLTGRVRAQETAGPGPLRLMYRIDGRVDLAEFELSDFDGYGGSQPVRIGNGAANQLQLDIYGEAMEAIYRVGLHGRHLGHVLWTDLLSIINWLVGNWDQPDEGIWETRARKQNFVYSRLMCWVAFDRAIRIARERGLPAPHDQWIRARDAIYDQIMERGYNEDLGAFVQHYETDALDASLLKMPLVGFVDPRDPRWLSTLDAMSKTIVSDSLVFRYSPHVSPDGIGGDEGTFSMCTFWYVEAMARAGYVDQARMIFEQMLTYSNHLGLYSEEIGVTGEQLGNFPQAFTHLALISAAVSLDAAMDKPATEYERLIPRFSWATEPR